MQFIKYVIAKINRVKPWYVCIANKKYLQYVCIADITSGIPYIKVYFN